MEVLHDGALMLESERPVAEEGPDVSWRGGGGAGRPVVHPADACDGAGDLAGRASVFSSDID